MNCFILAQIMFKLLDFHQLVYTNPLLCLEKYAILYCFFQRHVFTRTLARCHKSSMVYVARPLKFLAVIGLAAV